ncbi:hypothetical protein FXO37_05449 [Capsicum annuum]|nr:hypothetical protein FXO37_05449 [Capsicum annuum]
MTIDSPFPALCVRRQNCSLQLFALQLAPMLSQKLGLMFGLNERIFNLYVSHPPTPHHDVNFMKAFSFKLRGAYNMMANLSEEQLKRGVICSSAGNHAQGVALASHKLGCNAVIVMPVTTPQIKWKSVKRLGGQGTIGMEINNQLKDKIHEIFVPVGGGGLIAGIAAYMKRVAPDIKIIEVETTDANAMAMSLHYGHRVMLDNNNNKKPSVFPPSGVWGGDGVAVKMVGEETFRVCKELIDGVVLVNRDAICASIKDMFEEKRSILEPAGAVALAGAEAYCNYYGLKDENVVAITSGANMNFDRLRLISELVDVGRKRKAMLATFLPEKLGSFKEFCEQNRLSDVWNFYSGALLFKIMYSVLICRVALQTKSELEAMIERMGSIKLHSINLTDNDLVQDHFRHLGQIGANVLVGIQVPQDEFDEFQGCVARLGYECAVESHSDAFKLIMH